ncbi:hypothetical protein PPYR_01885 [Photinus pyralis]|uniref:Uncharacterized protein n=2 Tax=Photinus pyralis TaxID=7054 RepID=A0A5N4B5N3_PHOPY|nr:uncharacterized protein LOC116159454 [Photinus pyralis]KAB0804915.1 hypothetical protein PPYR_01885 [Photinus pyralis]
MNNVWISSCMSILLISTTLALPILPEFESEYPVEGNNTNGTAHDLYVIRTVVYEVGILTDADNSTDSDQSYEEVDLKIFDPKHNHSGFDPLHIPLPIETNFSRIAYTDYLLPDNLKELLSANTKTITQATIAPPFAINGTTKASDSV